MTVRLGAISDSTTGRKDWHSYSNIKIERIDFRAIVYLVWDIDFNLLSRIKVSSDYRHRTPYEIPYSSWACPSKFLYL